MIVEPSNAARCCPLAALFLISCGAQVLDLGEDLPIFDGPNDGSPGTASGEPICETGATRCNGAMLELCAQGGAWLSLQNCGAPQLCTRGGPELPAYCSPPDEQTCDVGRIGCNGQMLQLCTSDGWVDWQQCEPPYMCGASGGNVACVAGSPCNTGDTRCTGTAFEVCMPGEQTWEEWPQCAGACGENPDRDLPAYCR